MRTIDGDPPLRETRFDNRRFESLGIEWMALSEFRRRVPPDWLEVPERLDFYLLMLVMAGAGAHIVDFVRKPLRPGSLVFVHPGQVQQWRLEPGIEGSLVLITPQTVYPTAARSSLLEKDELVLDEWPAVSRLPDVLIPEISCAMAQLQFDFERFDGSALDAALIRHDVLGVLMRAGRWFASRTGVGEARSDNRAIYRLFVRELEKGFRHRLGVQDYAERLGYSESTLSRVCNAAEGRSAKQVIDRRVALEAARELVHSQASVAEIGHHLGFSEATNFVKFFRRMNGYSPQAFRNRMTMPGRLFPELPDL